MNTRRVTRRDQTPQQPGPPGQPGHGLLSAMNAQDQIVPTTVALNNWGGKVIDFGKKHPGKTYAWAYNNDQGYVSWVTARMNTLDGGIADFGNYCLTRQRLEQNAMANVQNNQ